jgi:hypothetical protein
MNSTIQAALNGTLKSPGPTGIDPVDALMGAFSNQLSIPIALYFIDQNGDQWPAIQGDDLGQVVLMPGESEIAAPILDGYYYVFRSALTGSFVSMFLAESPGDWMPVIGFVIDESQLVQPGALGRPPKPSGDILIPPDMPRILVGAGTLPNGNWILREQYWKRATDSYVLAPNSERTISTTSFSGKQNMSSSTDTLSTQVGFSSSVSFAVVSASVSASLSTTSTSFQEMISTNEVTQYESIHLINDDEKHPQMFLKWQLIEVITIFTPPAPGAALSTAKVTASVAHALSPGIIDGPRALHKRTASDYVPRIRGLVANAR